LFCPGVAFTTPERITNNQDTPDFVGAGQDTNKFQQSKIQSFNSGFQQKQIGQFEAIWLLGDWLFFGYCIFEFGYCSEL